MKTIRFTLGLLMLCALTASGATYKGVIIGTNSTFTPTAGNDNRFNYGNTAAALVIRDNGDAYLLDALGNVIMTYTNGATPVFMGKSVLVNGGVTGTEAGVPWTVGYFNVAGVPTNSATGDLGTVTFAQLATILGVFGVTNSIFGGTFGTNAQTGQTFIDAQGNISHTSTNATYIVYSLYGTNGAPTLLKIDGTNANGEVLVRGAGIMTVANALDFGADPTGSVDSTAAIQATIDSLGTIGGTAFVPRGTYNVTGTIHMRRNVTLQGEMSTYGANGTQLSKTGTGATIMLAFTSCTIRNIHISGQGVGNNQFGIISTNILDTAQSTTNFKLQDVKVEGVDVGFWIHNGWASEINTCYAQVCRDGILLSNTVDSIRIIGGEYQNCTNGIHLAGGNIYRIPIECLMENDVIGLLIEDDVAVDYNYGITVQNCWFEGDPTCIDATDVIQLQVINNTLSANAGGTNMIFRGGNRSSTISGNEIGGGCALHAVGSLVRGMLWENNYDSCTYPIVDSGTTGSIYIGANGLIGGNLVLNTGSIHATNLMKSIGITIDGGGSAITSGVKGFVEVPFACTVISATILGDQSGSIAVETWRTNSASIPPTRAGAMFTNYLTTAQASTDTTFSGNTSLALANQDRIGFNVTTNALSLTRITLQLRVQP